MSRLHDSKTARRLSNGRTTDNSAHADRPSVRFRPRIPHCVGLWLTMIAAIPASTAFAESSRVTQLKAEKQRLEPERKTLDAEQVVLTERANFFRAKKTEIDKDIARLKANHARLTSTYSSLKLEEAAIRKLREDYNVRREKYTKTTFRDQKAKKAEYDALLKLAEEGKSRAARQKTNVASYKANRASYDQESKLLKTTRDALRIQFDEYAARKKKHQAAREMLASRSTDLDKKLELAQGEERKAEDKLRQAQKSLATTDTTLKWLSRAALVAVLKGNPEAAKAKEIVDKIRSPLGELRKATDKLVALKGEEAKQETKGFFDKLKLINLNSQADEIDRISRAVDDLPVGLVSEKTNGEFSVTVDLLLNNPPQARQRFGDYLRAISNNIAYLQKQQSDLNELELRAQAASKVLIALNQAIEKAVTAGFFTKPLVEQYLDIDRLIRSYRGVAASAATKSKEMQRTMAVEKQRQDNLQSTLKTLFGFAF